MKDELDWDEYFLNFTTKIPTGNSGVSNEIGAVLVGEHHRIISFGFDGSPFRYSLRPYDTCPFGFTGNQGSSETLRADPPCHHAEYNAIIKAHEEDRRDSTIYLTHRPCTECHELILRSGIKMIIWKTPDGRMARERQYH